MLKRLALALILFASPAFAETIETKYFSINLPESFTHVEGNNERDKTVGKVYARGSQKHFLMLEFTNKENVLFGQDDIEKSIESMNKRSEHFEPFNPFFETKMQAVDCVGDCKAYFREGEIEDEQGGHHHVYEYVYQSDDAELFLVYWDGENAYEESRKIFNGFIVGVNRQ